MAPSRSPHWIFLSRTILSGPASPRNVESRSPMPTSCGTYVLLFGVLGPARPKHRAATSSNGALSLNG